MYKNILIVSYFVFQITNSNAQIHFKNESDFSSITEQYIPEIDSLYKLAKNNDFEFRLYQRSSTFPLPIGTLYILSNKEGKWNLRMFQKNFSKHNDITEQKIDTAGLDLLWAKIKKHHALSIPDKSKLLSGKYESPHVMDGTSYYFELFSATSKRRYSYYSPSSSIEDYPRLKILKDVIAIISLFYERSRVKKQTF